MAGAAHPAAAVAAVAHAGPGVGLGETTGGSQRLRGRHLPARPELGRGLPVPGGVVGRNLDLYDVVVLGLDLLVGAREQRPVERAPGLELVGRPEGHHPSPFDYGDPVGQSEGGAPVGNEHRRAAGEDPSQRRQDLLLDLAVHC